MSEEGGLHPLEQIYLHPRHWGLLVPTQMEESPSLLFVGAPGWFSYGTY